MKKLNKKGFTLVEMLVVIAIIAVLVAIIVPTTTSSTNKAKAATNAANLRSVKAELGIWMLQNDTDVSTATFSVDSTSKHIKVGTTDTGIAVPDGKAVGGEAAGAFTATISGGEVIVKYGSRDINAYSTYAETGNFPSP